MPCLLTPPKAALLAVAVLVQLQALPAAAQCLAPSEVLSADGVDAEEPCEPHPCLANLDCYACGAAEEQCAWCGGMDGVCLGIGEPSSTAAAAELCLEGLGMPLADADCDLEGTLDCGARLADDCDGDGLCKRCAGSDYRSGVCECVAAAVRCDDEGGPCEAGAECASDVECDGMAVCSLGHCVCDVKSNVVVNGDGICAQAGPECPEDSGSYCARDAACLGGDQCMCNVPFVALGDRCAAIESRDAADGVEIAVDMIDATAQVVHLFATDGATAMTVTPTNLNALVDGDEIVVRAGCSALADEVAALSDDEIVVGNSIDVAASCARIEVVPAAAANRGYVLASPLAPIVFDVASAAAPVVCPVDAEQVVDELYIDLDVATSAEHNLGCRSWRITSNATDLVNGTLGVFFMPLMDDESVEIFAIDTAGVTGERLAMLAGKPETSRPKILYAPGFLVNYRAGSGHDGEDTITMRLSYKAETEELVFVTDPLPEGGVELPPRGLVCDQFFVENVTAYETNITYTRPHRLCGTPFCFERQFVPTSGFSSFTIETLAGAVEDGDVLEWFSNGELLAGGLDPQTPYNNLTLVFRGEPVCPGTPGEVLIQTAPSDADYRAGVCEVPTDERNLVLANGNDAIDLDVGDGVVFNRSCITWTVTMAPTASPVIGINVTFTGLDLLPGDGFVGIFDGVLTDEDAVLLRSISESFYSPPVVEDIDFDAMEAAYNATNSTSNGNTSIIDSLLTNGTNGTAIPSPEPARAKMREPITQPVFAPIMASARMDGDAYVAPVMTIVVMTNDAPASIIASVKAIPAPPPEPMVGCLEHHITDAGGDSGTIEPTLGDPVHFPFYLPNHCELWHISGNWASIRFELTAIDTGLNEDKVVVYSGPDNVRGRSLGGYSGELGDAEKSLVSYTLGGDGTVHFFADNSTFGSGFTLEWEGLATWPEGVPNGAACDWREIIDTLPAFVTVGNMADGGGPGYPSDACLEWLIEPSVAPENGLHVQFVHVDTDEGDVVTILDGRDPVPPLGKLDYFRDPYAPVAVNISGSNVRADELPFVALDGDALDIVFRTDSIGSLSGFTIAIWAPSADGCVDMPPIVLNGTSRMTLEPFQNKERKTPPNFCQRWTVTAAPEMDVILFAFTEWKVLDVDDVLTFTSAGNVAFDGDEAPFLSEPIVAVRSDEEVTIEWRTSASDIVNTFKLDAYASVNLTDVVDSGLVAEVCQTIDLRRDVAGELQSRSPYDASVCIEAIIAPEGVLPGKWLLSFDYIDMSASTPLRMYSGGIERVPVNCTGVDSVAIDAANSTVDCIGHDGLVALRNETVVSSPEIFAVAGRPPLPGVIMPDSTSVTLVFRPPPSVENGYAGFRIRWLSINAEAVDLLFPGGDPDPLLVKEDAPGAELVNAPYVAGPQNTSITLTVSVIEGQGTVDGASSVRFEDMPIEVATSAGRSVKFAPAANWCGAAVVEYSADNRTATVPVTVQCVNDAPVVTAFRNETLAARPIIVAREPRLDVGMEFSDIDGLDTIMVEIRTSFGRVSVDAIDEPGVLFVDPRFGTGVDNGRVALEGPAALIEPAVAAIRIDLPTYLCNDTIDPFPEMTVAYTVHDLDFDLGAKSTTVKQKWTLDCVRRAKSVSEFYAVTMAATDVNAVRTAVVSHLGNEASAEADLTVLDVAFFQSDAGAFTLETNLSSVAIPPSSSIPLNVTFAPVRFGDHFAVMTLTTSDESRVIEIVLTATGLSADITGYRRVTFDPFDLDNNAGPVRKTISFRNTGNVPLVLNLVEIYKAADFSQISIVSTPRAAIPPGRPAAIVIQYHPTLPGTLDTYVEIHTNAIVRPLVRIPVSATASFQPELEIRAPDDRIVFINGLVSFGNTIMLEPDATQWFFKLSNTGQKQLAVTGMSISVVGSDDKGASKVKTSIGMPITLEPSEVVTVPLMFTFPLSRPAGPLRATIVLTSTSGGKPGSLFEFAVETILVPTSRLSACGGTGAVAAGAVVAGQSIVGHGGCKLENTGLTNVELDPSAIQVALDSASAEAGLRVSAMLEAESTTLVRSTGSSAKIWVEVDPIAASGDVHSWSAVVSVAATDGSVVATFVATGDIAHVSWIRSAAPPANVTGVDAWYTTMESAKTGTMVVGIDRALTTAVGIELALDADLTTATVVSDFRLPPLLVTIPPGKTSADVVLVVVDDGTEEAAENIALALPATGSVAVLAIEANDVPGDVTAHVDPEDEELEEMVITVVPPEDDDDDDASGDESLSPQRSSALIVRVPRSAVSNATTVATEILVLGSKPIATSSLVADSLDFTFAPGLGKFVGSSFAIKLESNVSLVDKIDVQVPFDCDSMETRGQGAGDDSRFALLLFDTTPSSMAWIRADSVCPRVSLKTPAVDWDACTVSFEICHLTQFAVSFVDDAVVDSTPAGVTGDGADGAAAETLNGDYAFLSVVAAIIGGIVLVAMAAMGVRRIARTLRGHRASHDSDSDSDNDFLSDSSSDALSSGTAGGISSASTSMSASTSALSSMSSSSYATSASLSESLS